MLGHCVGAIVALTPFCALANGLKARAYQKCTTLSNNWAISQETTC